MANRNEPEEHIDMAADDQPEQAANQPDGSTTAKQDVGTTAVKTPSADAANTPDTPPLDINDSTEEKPAEAAPKIDAGDPAVVIQSGRTHRFRHWLGRHKKVVIPVAVFVVVLGTLAAIPSTRYAIAGTVIKKQLQVTVVDSQTGKPVSSATVSLKGVNAQTDSQGKATLKVAVGNGTLSLSKHFYKDTNQPVVVALGKPVPISVSFVATGRQVPITVVNKITGKPLANATLSAEGTQAITDKNGATTVVLPADKKEVKGTITASNYNKLSVTVKITAAKDASNTFQITPAGKIYFLSNANGTLDVAKTDLDGANRQTVLKGTGKEDKSNTVLLASQNWKYLALLSKRDGGANNKLFLIDTSNDALSTMDEGDADFNLAGWSGTTFVYQVARHNKKLWDNKSTAIKSFEASTKKLTTLDETSASGTGFSDYFYESHTSIYILNNEVVYGKSISTAYPSMAAGHLAGFYSVRPDGSNKKTIKTWQAAASDGYVSLNIRPYNTSEVYVSSSVDSESLYEYENGQLKPVEGKKAQDIWNEQYSTYLFSPSNKLTFWGETRDGKNTLFVGDDNAENKKQLASVSDYQTFGWYTDDYVMLSKNGSELYIAPASDWGSQKPLKVTDYFKPSFSAPGYGKGYGGL